MRDPHDEAMHLMNDPDHLRRKAAWIRALTTEANSQLLERRLARAQELENQADDLEGDR